jgi:hypothetical protein
MTRPVVKRNRNRGKQERVWQEDEVPYHLRHLYRPGRPGEPHYIPVLKRAFWFSGDQMQHSGPWIEAIEAIDKLGDNALLLNLLKSDRELPHFARECLADLIERHQLVRLPNRPRTPIYDRTEAELSLLLAREYYRAYRAKGMSHEAALTQAAKDKSVDVEVLENGPRRHLPTN